VELPRGPASPAPAEPVLIAARSGTVVLARVESAPSPFGGPDTLYAIRRNGSITRLGEVDANTPIGQNSFSPGGDTFAYSRYRRSTNVCGQGGVTLVKLVDGSSRTVDLNRPAPGDGTGSQVSQMWWPADGPLTISYSSWNCSDLSTVVPQSVWQLSGDQWTQTTRDRALQVLDVTPHERAIVVPEQSDQPQTSGALVVDADGQRTTIRPQVGAIALIDRSAG